MRKAPLWAALAILAVPEAGYLLAHLAEGAPPGAGPCAVLILGYPTRADGSPHPVQRYRVRAGAEAFRREGCGVAILSGGAAHSPAIEARTMAELAVQEGIPRGKLALEESSRDTWGNIRLSLPRLEAMDRIFLVSDSLHARRARRYLCAQRPDLCPKARPSSSYRPFELYWMKWLGGANELRIYLKEAAAGLPAR